MREKTELEHRMNKDNIDICCIQATHLQKDKTLKVRGYQCFRTDRGGDRRKGGIITLIKSNINAFMSSSSNDGAEQHTVTVQEDTACTRLDCYAQTESTNKGGGAHHTDEGRHNFHKQKHTQGHQHTQHRTTADKNTHRQDQRHHSS